MYQISFYVPVDQVEEVKQALFAAGAGQVGQYKHCAWQILGQGQFLPLEGSQPFIGSTNQLEKVAEYKVEMICSDECIHAAMAALKESHPYETPASTVIKCEDF